LHAQFPPGKMIRPILCLSYCMDLGGDWQKLLPAAACLELLHTSSLIHDDLPAMDDDDMRRGRASCHIVFGEATAILAGDLLVALAHKTLANTDFSDSIKVRFLNSLSNAYLNLCLGQQLDLNGAGDEVLIRQIHKLKTAALFSATFEFGALGANVSEETVNLSCALGEQLGVSFQIVDDYLDLFSSEKGRQGGSDSKNKKTTFLELSDKEELVKIIDQQHRACNECLVELARTLKNSDKSVENIFGRTLPIIQSVFSKFR